MDTDGEVFSIPVRGDSLKEETIKDIFRNCDYSVIIMDGNDLCPLVCYSIDQLSHKLKGMNGSASVYQCIDEDEVRILVNDFVNLMQN